MIVGNLVFVFIPVGKFDLFYPHITQGVISVTLAYVFSDTPCGHIHWNRVSDDLSGMRFRATITSSFAKNRNHRNEGGSADSPTSRVIGQPKHLEEYQGEFETERSLRRWRVKPRPSGLHPIEGRIWIRLLSAVRDGTTRV